MLALCSVKTSLKTSLHGLLSSLTSVGFSPDRWEHQTGEMIMETQTCAADPYSDILQNSWNWSLCLFHPCSVLMQAKATWLEQQFHNCVKLNIRSLLVRLNLVVIDKGCAVQLHNKGPDCYGLQRTAVGFCFSLSFFPGALLVKNLIEHWEFPVTSITTVGSWCLIRL